MECVIIIMYMEHSSTSEHSESTLATIMLTEYKRSEPKTKSDRVANKFIYILRSSKTEISALPLVFCWMLCGRATRRNVYFHIYIYILDWECFLCMFECVYMACLCVVTHTHVWVCVCRKIKKIHGHGQMSAAPSRHLRRVVFMCVCILFDTMFCWLRKLAIDIYNANIYWQSNIFIVRKHIVYVVQLEGY